MDLPPWEPAVTFALVRGNVAVSMLRSDGGGTAGGPARFPQTSSAGAKRVLAAQPFDFDP
jgi:hypothetical protein